MAELFNDHQENHQHIIGKQTHLTTFFFFFRPIPWWILKYKCWWQRLSTQDGMDFNNFAHLVSKPCEDILQQHLLWKQYNSQFIPFLPHSVGNFWELLKWLVVALFCSVYSLWTPQFNLIFRLVLTYLSKVSFTYVYVYINVFFYLLLLDLFSLHFMPLTNIRWMHLHVPHMYVGNYAESDLKPKPKLWIWNGNSCKMFWFGKFDHWAR